MTDRDRTTPATAPEGAAPDAPHPWGPGAATGVGSMPGEDAREAARVVTGSLPTLPFVPELPGRGPGADLVGRTAGTLVELYAQLEPSGWRLADRPGRDTRRARTWLAQDLDAIEEFAQDHRGPLKIAVAGPWTLAAALQRRNGEAMLGDPGACRDLAASLAEGVRLLLDGLRRRLPHARPVLQLDEPALTTVLAGGVPTASGYRRHRAVEPAVAEETLRRVVTAAGGDPVVVHSCAPHVPLALLRRAGATGVSFDLALLTERAYDEVAEAAEAGTALFTGVLPGAGADPAELSDPAGTVQGVRSLRRRLGLSPELWQRTVVVTPTCGLAGASPAYARAALARCDEAARALFDDPE